MPSQQGTSRFAIRAGIIGVVGLGLTIGLMILMLKLAGTSTEIDVRLGDVDFRGIVADDLADEISKNGPIPFPDLVGGDRPIWINHFGNDSSEGWFVFLAKVPDGESGCFVQWVAKEKMFVDFCDPQNQFPPNGFGLEELNWQVIENELRIEINDLSGTDLND
ncbi:MAG: hypothetical protein P8K64_07975 [Acidimicrobiales bacterium]|jgi:hypothetical protein|nr:hypothetical protein [Acidimicrobiales bacterium]|tara:strand:+ start:362 stop:850 length:489 start_codon:yes stop_codon:yes gene_type:complete